MMDACRAIGAGVFGPVKLAGDNVGRFTRLLLRHIKPHFALINSIESRQMGICLWHAGIPTVALLHEFAAYTRPHNAIHELALQSDVTIFSTRLTRDNALEYHPELSQMDLPVVPQGRCILPPTKSEPNVTGDSSLHKLLRPTGFPANGIVVLGLGTVCLRKGVDLFLDCAIRVKRMNPQTPIRFVWIGKGFSPDFDIGYSVFLADQIRRGGLEDMIEIIDGTTNLDQVYATANILLLTSRLDPLPNVAVDALVENIPVICFDQTTGIVDYLKTHGLEKHCVARYLDTADMADKLLALAHSAELRSEIGKKSSEMAVESFSMPRYAESIATIAETQIRRRQNMERSAGMIAAENIIRPDFFLMRQEEGLSPLSLAKRYVLDWKRNVSPRKPFPGFHPGIYREMKQLPLDSLDPLADYLQAGRPKGPWSLPVITPQTATRGSAPRNVALHIHAYYLDLLPVILDRLQRNQTSIDLLVSVTSEENRQEALKLLETYQQGRIDIRVTPNRGRDLGPFLTGFGAVIGKNYQLIGHLHTKKSPFESSALVQQWWNFLLENVVGGSAPMADITLQAMSDDENIGMVFPDDPNPISWDKNRIYAEALATRLRLPPLPQQISFPVGSMFWARTSSLQALFDLNLTWDDYPAEPVPSDGTLLHAIERLLPGIVRASGRDIAVTNVPGVTR